MGYYCFAFEMLFGRNTGCILAVSGLVTIFKKNNSGGKEQNVVHILKRNLKGIPLENWLRISITEIEL